MKKNKLVFTSFFLIIMCFLFLLDIWTKDLAEKYLMGQEDIILIPNVLCLHYLENTGAAFGILKGQMIIFYILTLAICIGIVIFIWKLPLEKKSLLPAISGLLLLSGALGNLKDRVNLHYVVDFIYFSLIDFPVFNVADIYVTTGAALWMLHLVLEKE